MTGLIYLVIIALWAAVLIPMWLRRHDQISEVRSTARFSSAMRSLGSQGQPQYAMGMVDVSMRSSVQEVPLMRPTSTTRPEGIDPAYERELSRQSAATRRAVVLGILAVVLLGTLVAAVVCMVPRWAPALAAVPVIAFVVAAALTSSQRSSATAARTTRPQRRPRTDTRTEAPAERARPTAPAQSDDDWENWNT